MLNNVQPSVWIILLNWNGWRDTVECIASLDTLETNNLDTKIVVIDNGSTDDSVARITERYPSLELLKSDLDLGAAGGFNIAIRKAMEENVDYVWLLNNDAIATPMALAELVKAAESDERIGFAASVSYYKDAPQKIQAWGGGWISFLTGRVGHYRDVIGRQKLQYLTGASVLLRCTALKSVGLLDEKRFFMYWEDGDLSFRMRNSGWRLHVCPESHVFHGDYAEEGKKTSPLVDLWYCESGVRFFRRYAPFPAYTISVFLLNQLRRKILLRNSPGFIAVLKGAWLGLTRKEHAHV
jgi:GT2 family glycosyltransferase